MTTRIFNALLGVWLFFSAFMWPHSPTAKVITIVCAFLTTGLAILSIYNRAASYVNAAVGIVLFLSALLMSNAWQATTWNNAIVAAAIFVVALIDRGPANIRQEREFYGRI